MPVVPARCAPAKQWIRTCSQAGVSQQSSERQQTERCCGSGYPAAGGNSATDEAHRRRKELARPSACADQTLRHS
eukprot:COSAG04_NODE_164_length_21771_cov_415.923219_2_plen_75_part_00